MAAVEYLFSLASGDSGGWGTDSLRMSLISGVLCVLMLLYIFRVSKRPLAQRLSPELPTTLEMIKAIKRPQTIRKRALSIVIIVLAGGGFAAYLYMISIGFPSAFAYLCLAIPFSATYVARLLLSPPKRSGDTLQAIGALYLRSFASDKLPNSRLMGSWLFKISALHPTSFLVARGATMEGQIYGAVRISTDYSIAVGEPGRLLPRVGFARKSFSNDRWQGHVLKLMRESAVIVLAPSESKWVDWEMQQINAQSLQAKTIVAFLPGSKSERQSAITAVASRLNGFSEIATMYVNGDLELILAYQTRENHLTCIFGRPWDGAAYFEAMVTALYEKSPQRSETLRYRARSV
jgi:hypothetical protein